MSDHQETSIEHWIHPKLYDHLLHLTEITCSFLTYREPVWDIFLLQLLLSTTCMGPVSVRGHWIQPASGFVNLQFNHSERTTHCSILPWSEVHEKD